VKDTVTLLVDDPFLDDPSLDDPSLDDPSLYDIFSSRSPRLRMSSVFAL
jgi:hypothetical protein